MDLSIKTINKKSSVFENRYGIAKYNIAISICINIFLNLSRKQK